MSADPNLAKLKAMQDENAELFKKVASLRKQRKQIIADRSQPDSNDPTSPGYISLQNRLKEEEIELGNLRRDFNSLSARKRQLSDEIDTISLRIRKTLQPRIKEEEDLTTSFYESIMAQCSKLPGIDTKALSILIDEVQRHRRQVDTLTQEYQKISHHLEFNKMSKEASDVPAATAQAAQLKSFASMPIHAAQSMRSIPMIPKPRVSFRIAPSAPSSILEPPSK